MALSDIKTLVKATLPYLVDELATDELIRVQLLTLFYLMQGQTNKTEEEVEEEASYSNLEKLFFAAYVSYELYRTHLAKATAGTAGSVAEPLKTVKRAKADVVEVEYEVLKNSSQTPLELLESLKNSVCEKARLLSYRLEMCSGGAKKGYPGTFIFRGGTPHSPGAATY